MPPRSSVLNYTYQLDRLIRDIVRRCDTFRHIDCQALLTSLSKARSRRSSGDVAQLLPMRFEGGSRERTVRGLRYEIVPLYLNGHEILYVISFVVPRFWELDLQSKLVTTFHELYHVNPEFNGDIRRFPGRNYAHGRSRRQYDERMAELVAEYREQNPPQDLLDLLALDSGELRARYREITGRRIRRRTVRRAS